jgi:hypothetical protein
MRKADLKVGLYLAVNDYLAINDVSLMVNEVRAVASDCTQPIRIQCPAIALHATTVRSLPIESHAPRHPHKPGAETIAVAQLMEASVGLGERLLGDVLRVFAIAEDAISDTDGKGGRFDQPDLEFAGQVRIHGQAVVPGMESRSELGAIMHVALPR